MTWLKGHSSLSYEVNEYNAFRRSCLQQFSLNPSIMYNGFKLDGILVIFGGTFPWWQRSTYFRVRHYSCHLYRKNEPACCLIIGCTSTIVLGTEKFQNPFISNCHLNDFSFRH